MKNPCLLSKTPFSWKITYKTKTYLSPSHHLYEFPRSISAAKCVCSLLSPSFPHVVCNLCNVCSAHHHLRPCKTKKKQLPADLGYFLFKYSYANRMSLQNGKHYTFMNLTKDIYLFFSKKPVLLKRSTFQSTEEEHYFEFLFQQTKN